MSFGDEFSDASFDESGFSARDEPPTLDETLFDIRLYGMFINYMKSQQAAQNLQFIKQARLLRLYNAPRDVYVQQAVKMIWTYFAECAPAPVTVSGEVKKKMQELALDPDAEVTLDKDSFSVAFGEVYNNVVPHFRNWISTNEWRDAIPFHRLAPPTFNIVLTSGTLRVLFNKYIKAQLDHDSDGSVAHAFHLWKFCIIANDFRDGKYSHSSHIDGKKKKKKGDDDDDEKEKEEDGDKDEKEETNPEEYAKRLYKKYKHQVSLPYDGSIPYAVYIVRALDHAIEEFDKSALFARWVSLKQYQGVDYQAKVVHQTLTADGFVEPPTLAAALTSSMLPFFLVMLRGTEPGLNIEFMVDVMKFRKKYDSFDKSSGGSTGSASTDTSRKSMVEEARRMYSKYLESGEMYCDPGLVEEVHNAISKSGGKAVTATLFRKCGAFIYHRSEHSWARQARATIVWTNKSYDNRSKGARALEEEFAFSVLPQGIDLQFVPSLDDVLACSELMWDYAGFVPKELNDDFAKYRAAYEEYFVAPVHQRKPLQEKVAAAYGVIADKHLPDLKPIHRFFAKEASQRDRLTDSVFTFLSNSIIRAVARKYFSRWIVEHSMKWKTVSWSPVPTVTFSDMTDLFSMNAIEKKIEEEALKGKSGLSKFLAKRQVKKQAIANVRTAPAKDLSANSNTVFTTKGAGDMLAFGDLKGASELKADSGESTLLVPTISETLSSTYLRKLFETMYLSSVISASDMTFWEVLCKFYTKYSVKDDDKLIEAQDEMRSEIEKIVDKYQALFKNPAEIKERAKTLKIIFPQFFRLYEEEIYGHHHEEYEKVLRSKGWK